MRVIRQVDKSQQPRIQTVRRSTRQTCEARNLTRLASRLRRISAAVAVSITCRPRTCTRSTTCSSSSQSTQAVAHLANARAPRVITQTPPTSNNCYSSKLITTSRRQRITTRQHHRERCPNKRSFRKSAEIRKDEER